MNDYWIALSAISLCAIAGFLGTITLTLTEILKLLKRGVIQMRDVDRAKVYREHLGEKLR